jgi:hypothetical protein
VLSEKIPPPNDAFHFCHTVACPVYYKSLYGALLRAFSVPLVYFVSHWDLIGCTIGT